MKYFRQQTAKGMVLLNVLIFAMVVIIVVTALIAWAATALRASRQLAAREQAFAIAEAGIDYYRWHLAHASTDYKDGDPTATTTGPFIHEFKDKDGSVIGHYALTITPPPNGSTVVVIKSKGTVVSDPTVSRTLQVTMAIPSLAKYAVVSNSFARFGEGTEVFGPIHSNGGIRFDGLAHNIVTSARDKFIDSTNGSSYRFGVYTTQSPQDPNPPAAVPNRLDVFMAGREFPVPAVDFAGITTNFSALKGYAQDDGYYFAASGYQGYRIVLKTNDTFDLYRVTSLRTANGSCRNIQDEDNWGTWSIQNQTFLQNYPFPANGIIFVEDNIWVEGQINTARLTIAAGRFPDSPTQRRSITVNNDLLYTNYDGRDVIGLIAQGDINAGLSSADDIRIDAALIAQNGRVGRHYYSNGCGMTFKRDTITLFGMIGTNEQYGFSYTDGTGYANRNIIYDANLLYSPPPHFPLTSDQYSTISWQEVPN